MSIGTVKMLNLRFPRENLKEVLETLVTEKNIKLIESQKIVNDVKDVNKMIMVSDYKDIKDRIESLSKQMNLTLSTELTPSENLDVVKVNQYLDSIDEQIKEINRIKDDLYHDKKENEDVVEFLKRFTTKNINVEELMDCHYVNVKFGYLDNNQLDNLKYYLEKPFIFDIMRKEAKITWCYYVVTKNMKPEVDNLFKALNFHEVEIPHIVHGNNEDALEELDKEAKTMNDYLLHMDQKLNILKEEEKLTLSKYYVTSTYLDLLESYKKYVVDYTSILGVTGYVDESLIEECEQHFTNIKDIQFSVLPLHLIKNEEDVPVITHNVGWVEPFLSISHPTINDKRDVTIAYAVIYLLVFALCFGDLAMGALLLIFGFINKNKLIQELSLATILGGLLYGTYFYEFSLYSLLPIGLSTRLLCGAVILIISSIVLKIIRK